MPQLHDILAIPLRLFRAVLVVAGAIILIGVPSAHAQGLLPFDRTNPVMYDNDFTNDYVDWYLMALASAGEISYRGISTTSSIAPHNRYVDAARFDWEVANRTNIVLAGRNSGFRNVPNPVRGPRGHLLKPSSGRIEDTKSLNSVGTQAILAQARAASAAKPLVVCMGGQLTAAADAYLLDNSIADKMVVVSVDSPSGFTYYNGWCDGWAAYIALVKLRLVNFPVNYATFPKMSKQWIQDNLPNSQAKTWMLSLKLDSANGSDGDVDGLTVVAIRRPDFVQAIKRVSFSGWQVAYSDGPNGLRIDGHEVPMFKDDPIGRAIVVTQASGTIATQEYQRAFKNPASWGVVAPAPTPNVPPTVSLTSPANGSIFTA
jgi:hypothetical protein